MKSMDILNIFASLIKRYDLNFISGMHFSSLTSSFQDLLSITFQDYQEFTKSMRLPISDLKSSLKTLYVTKRSTSARMKAKSI